MGCWEGGGITTQITATPTCSQWDRVFGDSPIGYARVPLLRGLREKVKLRLTETDTGRRLNSDVVLTINFNETAEFERVVFQEIWQNEVWDWRRGQWVPRPDGAYSGKWGVPLRQACVCCAAGLDQHAPDDTSQSPRSPARLVKMGLHLRSVKNTRIPSSRERAASRTIGWWATTGT